VSVRRGGDIHLAASYSAAGRRSARRRSSLAASSASWLVPCACSRLREKRSAPPSSAARWIPPPRRPREQRRNHRRSSVGRWSGERSDITDITGRSPAALARCRVAPAYARPTQAVRRKSIRSDSSARVPGSAFELRRISSDVLSRLVPVASSQRLHARAAAEYERRIDFPAAASAGATRHRASAASRPTRIPVSEDAPRADAVRWPPAPRAGWSPARARVFARRARHFYSRRPGGYLRHDGHASSAGCTPAVRSASPSCSRG
jgi:hypothetical protein